MWIALIVYKSGLATHMMLVTLNQSAPTPVTSDHAHNNGHDVIRHVEHTKHGDDDVRTLKDSPRHEEVTSLHDDVHRKYDDVTVPEALLQHEKVDHWTKLPYAHWPTLFGFYNISIWNRCVSTSGTVSTDYVTSCQSVNVG